MQDASPIGATHSGGTTCCMPFRKLWFSGTGEYTKTHAIVTSVTSRRFDSAPFPVDPDQRTSSDHPRRSGKCTRADN